MTKNLPSGKITTVYQRCRLKQRSRPIQLSKLSNMPILTI